MEFATVKVLLFANTEWYLYNFRLPLARALRNLGAEVVMVSPDGPYGARLREEGFRWIALPMSRRSLNPLREMLLLLRLVRLYRDERPAIVHHFTIKCVVYGSLVAKLVGVRRRINAIAGMGYVFMNTELKARILRAPVRLLLRLAFMGDGARLVVQNSDDFAAFAGTSVIGDRKMRLIRGSGVDTDAFQPRPEPRPYSQQVRILFAARILWDKGANEYVEAAKILKARGRDVEFLMAGEPDAGNPATVPVQIVEGWRRAGVVRLLGHVSDMKRVLDEVDVAVLPSYREGAPRSLIEAAACGLPIVTTDVPGCREIVEHDLNGLIVPARDSRALADAIMRLVDDPGVRRRMGAAGRQKVLAEYDEGIVLHKTICIYRELLAGVGQLA